MSTIGQRLREARERKGWSQTLVCEKLKLSNSRLSGYERDYRTPDPSTLSALADLYEVTTDYLYDKTNDPQGHSRESTKDEIRKKALFFDEENMDEEDWELVKQTYERLRRKRKKNK